jgi:Fe-S-cluster formation regulator IscX/YfhJ
MGLPWSSSDAEQFETWVENRVMLNRCVRELKREKRVAFSDFEAQEKLCFEAETEAESRVAARKAVHRGNRAFMCQHKLTQLEELQQSLRRQQVAQSLSPGAKALCEQLCDAALELDFETMKFCLEQLKEHFAELELFDDRHELDSDALIEEYEVQQMLNRAKQMRTIVNELEMTSAQAVKATAHDSSLALHERLQALLKD